MGEQSEILFYIVVLKKNGDDGTKIAIPTILDEFVIGRDPSCFLQLKKNIEVSRRHAKIEFDEFGTPWIAHLGSNPTYVNGEEVIDGMVELFHKDIITIGERNFRFELNLPSKEQPRSNTPKPSYVDSKSIDGEYQEKKDVIEKLHEQQLQEKQPKQQEIQSSQKRTLSTQSGVENEELQIQKEDNDHLDSHIEEQSHELTSKSPSPVASPRIPPSPQYLPRDFHQRLNTAKCTTERNGNNHLMNAHAMGDFLDDDKEVTEITKYVYDSSQYTEPTMEINIPQEEILNPVSTIPILPCDSDHTRSINELLNDQKLQQERGQQIPKGENICFDPVDAHNESTKDLSFSSPHIEKNQEQDIISDIPYLAAPLSPAVSPSREMEDKDIHLTPEKMIPNLSNLLTISSPNPFEQSRYKPAIIDKTSVEDDFSRDHSHEKPYVSSRKSLNRKKIVITSQKESSKLQKEALLEVKGENSPLDTDANKENHPINKGAVVAEEAAPEKKATCLTVVKSRRKAQRSRPIKIVKN